MVNINQDLQALFDDIMGLQPFDIGNESNATSIVLVAGVV
jgi:hypothetical protein